MEQNQKSHATGFNRYPKIFKEIFSITPKPNHILSFGCSTGKECNTLHKIYYPNTKITGLDISKKIINQNKKSNRYKNIEYFSSIAEISNNFDLIFAMSVLCKWPENIGEYTFETFTDTLNIIDKLLKKDGYLCIYNSKYLFTETALFKEKYAIVDTKQLETGFVYKYHSDNTRLKDDYPYFLFKKGF